MSREGSFHSAKSDQDGENHGKPEVAQNEEETKKEKEEIKIDGNSQNESREESKEEKEAAEEEDKGDAQEDQGKIDIYIILLAYVCLVNLYDFILANFDS